MGSILWRSFWRSLFYHPWQLILSLFGVALGVGLVLSIDLANQSAQRAFTLATDSVVGRTTHHIIGTVGGLPEQLYRKLRIAEGIRPSASVVERYARAVDFPGRTFHVLGIDPLVDRPFRSYLAGSDNSSPLDLSALISKPGTGLLSGVTANRLGLAIGDALHIRVGSYFKTITIIGLLQPDDKMSRQALENICITDIATAQELLNMKGRLDRIDLIIQDNEEGWAKLKRIEKILPPDAEIIRAKVRSENIETMTRAFQMNLTALSLFALIVGMFIIYNAITFSVIRRRLLIGTLRCLGTTRREVFALVLSEAMITGVLGTVLGVFIGVILGQYFIRLVTQSINDLYFVLSVRDLDIAPVSLLKGWALGIGATLIASLGPALEATASPPRTVIIRSTLETMIQQKSPKLAAAGLALCISGAGLLFISGKNISMSYLGLFIILLGCVFPTPWVITVFMNVLLPFLSRFWGLIGRLAVCGISGALSRTAVAIAALTIAIASTIGVGIMIESFRMTVDHWLNTLLKADIYVSAPRLVATRGDAMLNPDLVNRIRSLQEVAFVGTFHWFDIEAQEGITRIGVIEMVPPSYKNYIFKEGEPNRIWPLFERGEGVLVSEPYAFKHDVQVGSNLSLRTEQGLRNFPVLGIFVSYSSDQGLVMISRQMYEKYWTTIGVSSLWLYAKPDSDIDALIQSVQHLVGRDEEVQIRSNRHLREETLKVFDRTFAITAVMRLLAIVVAFIGVISALMALQLERHREFGTLRALGFTPRQILYLILTQTGLMGLVAGLLAIPVGIITAIVMIFVINHRSFGWTMQMEVGPEILLQALVLSLIAAVLAGIFPAYRIAKQSTASALRQE